MRGGSPRRRPPHEKVELRVDLRLRADVDPARRLVEEEDVAVRGEEPRERHLLLVPPRARTGAEGLEQRIRTRSIHGAAARSTAAGGTKPELAHSIERSERHVVRDGEVAREPFAGAVLGDHADAPAPALARRRRPWTPRTSRLPRAMASSPKTARRSSVRPEPMSPAIPTISPRRTSSVAERGSRTPASSWIRTTTLPGVARRARRAPPRRSRPCARRARARRRPRSFPRRRSVRRAARGTGRRSRGLPRARGRCRRSRARAREDRGGDAGAARRRSPRGCRRLVEDEDAARARARAISTI